MTFNDIQNDAASAIHRLRESVGRRIAAFVLAKAAYIALLLGLRPEQVADRQGLFLFAAGPQFAETESRLAEWAAGAPTYLMEAIFVVSTLRLMLGAVEEDHETEAAGVARGALYVGALAGLALVAMAAGPSGAGGLLVVIALQCFLDSRLILLWPLLATRGRFEPTRAWTTLSGRWTAPLVATAPIAAASAMLILFAGGTRSRIDSLGSLLTPRGLIFAVMALAVSAIAATITAYWCAVAAVTFRRSVGRGGR